ncbi:MAG: signal transduction histidine kinase CheA [Myxococcaceae bacterium]|nr:signal transduction histidine kinase CheA [Myxococcaceae bacterium]
MTADPYRYFRVEAAELHQELAQGVLDLERGAHGDGLVPRLLRQAHTLKGAARVVRQREIANHAHAIEDALSPYRESTAAVARDHIDTLMKLLDLVAALIAGLPSSGSGEAPRVQATIEEAFRTVRPDVAEMDALLDGIGEAHTQLGAVRRSQSSLERARHLIDVLVEQLSGPRTHEGSRAGAAVAAAKTHSIAQEVRTVFAGLERGFASAVHQLDLELRQVRDAAEHMRLVPVGSLFTSLERAVRDVAQAQGKVVRFEGRGHEVRLDAHVLGAVQGALLQLVRNAVAHGIEPHAERNAAGKPVEGSVVLEVTRRGRRAAFICTDDGRGVDLDAVRRAAQRKGLLSADIEELSAEKLLDLLLRGRLSTATNITEVSGRGIGLDLLRDAAERLGGEVSVRTGSGRGTTVELVVPLSVASLHALIVEAAGSAAAIPLDAVRGTVRLARSDVARTPQGESIAHAGTAIPFVALAKLLALRSTPFDAPLGTAVIVHGADGLAAIGVDRLLGTATVIQRPLPELAPSTGAIAGASIDSHGTPQLVLDPDGLVAAARVATSLPERPETRQRRILVIDDSLTTRMLEQSILESAGYAVDLASSGEEGLERARKDDYALFLVDVEMPGMDGFSFIIQTRAEPALRDVPCILVTSRAEPEDRQRGREAGASGYIVKGEFDQNELLAQIRRLVT